MPNTRRARRIFGSHSSSHFKRFKSSRIHSKARKLGSTWTQVERRWKAVLHVRNAAGTPQKEVISLFFPKIWGFILEKWLSIYDSKYSPSLSTDKSGRVPSIETEGIRKEQRLESTAASIRPPISAFPSMTCRSYDMWLSIVMLEDNFFASLLLLWPLLLQFSAQTHQLRSIQIPCDSFTQFQQLIIHHTELVPQNAAHNLGTVNIRCGRRRGGMSGHSQWFSALGMIIVDSFFVAGHNAM